MIELDFETKEAAKSFRQFLTTVVWANPEASSAFAGAPTARVMESAIPEEEGLDAVADPRNERSSRL